MFGYVDNAIKICIEEIKTIHIRNRNDLLKFLESNAPLRAIARATQEGQVENLGAFKQIFPGSVPGWIVKVTSKFNKTWYVVIQVSGRGFKARIIDTVPWKLWIGEIVENKLYQGDNPLRYKELRDV